MCGGPTVGLLTGGLSDIGNGWSGLRNGEEALASLVGNYYLPGSSLLTDHIVSQGAQNELNTGTGQILQLASGAAGGGVGSGFTGIPSAADEGAGWSGVGNALSNFSDSTGLSSLFGGTAQPTSNFLDAYNGVYGAPGASASVADAAANPAVAPSLTSPLYGAVPNSGAVGASAGGTSGGGFDLGSIGSDSGGLPSSNGIGGAANTGGLAADSSNAASFNPSLFNTSPSASIAGGANGVGTGLGNQLSIPGTGSGASNMGLLSSIFGGSSGSSGATPGAGTGITNALLKGGLGYLLNQPNTAGANAINSATTQAQSNFAPYMAAGTGAENTLANLYGNNGADAQTAAQQNFQNTPGYQFALNQGINAVNANAAAMGSPLSGNNQQAVNNYAQGTANQTYNNYVNQLQNLASGGLTAAGGSGTAGLTGASAISQLDQNKANAANTAIGTGLQGLFPTSGVNLASLFGNGGAGNQGGLLSLFQ